MRRSSGYKTKTRACVLNVTGACGKGPRAAVSGECNAGTGKLSPPPWQEPNFPFGVCALRASRPEMGNALCHPQSLCFHRSSL